MEIRKNTATKGMLCNLGMTNYVRYASAWWWQRVQNDFLAIPPETFWNYGSPEIVDYVDYIGTLNAEWKIRQ